MDQIIERVKMPKNLPWYYIVEGGPVTLTWRSSDGEGVHTIISGKRVIIEYHAFDSYDGDPNFVEETIRSYQEKWLPKFEGEIPVKLYWHLQAARNLQFLNLALVQTKSPLKLMRFA